MRSISDWRSNGVGREFHHESINHGKAKPVPLFSMPGPIMAQALNSAYDSLRIDLVLHSLRRIQKRSQRSIAAQAGNLKREWPVECRDEEPTLTVLNFAP